MWIPLNLLFLSYYPAGICLFKITRGNTRTMCEFCSKLTKYTPEWHDWLCSGILFVNFEQISHISAVSNVDFEKINACCVKRYKFLYAIIITLLTWEIEIERNKRKYYRKLYLIQWFGASQGDARLERVWESRNFRTEGLIFGNT